MKYFISSTLSASRCVFLYKGNQICQTFQHYKEYSSSRCSIYISAYLLTDRLNAHNMNNHHMIFVQPMKSDLPNPTTVERKLRMRDQAFLHAHIHTSISLSKVNKNHKIIHTHIDKYTKTSKRNIDHKHILFYVLCRFSM